MSGFARFTAKIIQDGITVARVEAVEEHECEREIQHYAAQYGQDGEIKIVRNYRLATKDTGGSI